MTSQRHEFALVVVGAGPAGISAACAAAEAGQRVALLDGLPWPGGQIWRGGQTPASAPAARRWFQRLRDSGAQSFACTRAFAAPSPGHLLAEAPTGVLDFGWQKLILATGARELFLPFPGWTLPGVVGPGGLHAMAKAGWPVPGKRVVVAGSGPLLLAAADGLKQHGAQVRLIAEQTSWGKVCRFGCSLLRHPAKLAQGLGMRVRLLDIPYRCGCWPLRAEGTDSVRSVTLTDGSRAWTEDCDYLACAFSLAPNLELPRLLGCAVVEGFVRVNEYQETSVKNVFCAGEPTGIGGADRALVEGRIAGLAAAGLGRQARALLGRRASWHHFHMALHEAFALRPELRQVASSDTIVCRCEDVQRQDLEPYSNWTAAKLHTRCGMGACQGRVCGAATRFLFGWDNASVRPPVFPVNLASLAGKVEDVETSQPNQTPKQSYGSET
jgi:NADPH-dependent 2,4-dienoyl-CoA reductase/sulfur reductase-like enzyme